MRKIIMFAILAMAPISIFAEEIKCDNSWYVGAKYHQNTDMNFKFVGNDLLGGLSYKESTSPSGYGLYGGCRLDKYFFYDIEMSFWQSKVGDDDLSVKTWALSTMYSVGVGKEFLSTTIHSIMPYIAIGAGFGGLTVEINTPYYYLDTYNGRFFNLAYQVMAGMKFAALRHIEFDIGTKYINYGKVENTTRLYDVKLGKSSVSAIEAFVGLAYKF